MTSLYVFTEEDGSVPLFSTADPEQIRSTLKDSHIGFEQWQVEADVDRGDSPQKILDTYEHWICDLKQRGGYATADVLAMTPEHPERVALRGKFLDEHVHSEDEVRFFVAGRGAFFLHVADRVMAVVCERGDLIRVPANTRHWFDMGPAPDFVVIRVFTNPAGWVAQFTGTALASRFPRFEPGGLLYG